MEITKTQSSILDGALLACCSAPSAKELRPLLKGIAGMDSHLMDDIPQVMRQLMKLGANPNVTEQSVGGDEKELESALYRATMQAHAEVVALVDVLLESGADVHFRAKENDWTPLHAAVAHSNYEVVQHLLLAGANMDDRSSHGGWTPLMLATLYSEECLLTLLEFGADANVLNEDGRSAFDTVVVKFGGSLSHGILGIAQKYPRESVKKLITWGRDSGLLFHRRGEGSAIHEALVGELEPELICAFIEVSARLQPWFQENQIDWMEDEPLDECTPLIAVLSQPQPSLQIIGALLRYGAKTNTRDQNKLSALHLAAQAPNAAELIPLLLEYGANPLSKDKLGRTPSDLASDMPVFQLLCCIEQDARSVGAL